MKIGVIGRADGRGLGVQSYEISRCLPADKTLVLVAGVDLTNNRPLSPYTQHPERYDHGWVRTIDWNVPAAFPEAIIREFLSGLDCVWSAETFYDSNILSIAKEMKVVTILHANPEFYSYHHNPNGPQPDVIWLPTPWLSSLLPDPTVVPFPVNRTHVPFRLRSPSTPTFLHIAGHRTQRDRNGTLLILRTLRYLRNPTNFIIRSQDRLPAFTPPRHISVDLRIADIDNYADLYAEGDVAVQPRKFGGLSLPLNESLAAGIPVLMPNCPPQNSFLPSEFLIPARMDRRQFRTHIGPISLYETHPRDLASIIERLTKNPAEIEQMSKMADELAQQISWDTLRPTYFREFQKAIDMVKQ